MVQKHSDAKSKGKRETSERDLVPSTEKKEKETITLAIDKNALDDIRRSAAGEGMSINGFINSILVKWTNYYKHHKENQAVIMTAKNFQAHLEHLNEDVLVNEFKDNAINLVPAVLAERNIPLTLDNLINYEYKTFGVLGGAFQSVNSYMDEEGCRCIIIRQGHGIKWSRILAKAISVQLESLFR